MKLKTFILLLAFSIFILLVPVGKNSSQAGALPGKGGEISAENPGYYPGENLDKKTSHLSPEASNAGWEEVGTGSASGQGISAGSNGMWSMRWSSVAVDNTGTPYVAWNGFDMTISNLQKDRVFLKKWDGSQWVGLGASATDGISGADTNAEELSLAISPDGNPYAAYVKQIIEDSNSLYVVCLRYWNGSAWVGLGGSDTDRGISQYSSAEHPSIAFSPGGKLYVTWQENDGDYSGIYIRSWNGSKWDEVGQYSASFDGISDTTTPSRNPSIAFSPDGIPYVAWEEEISTGNNEIYVRRFVNGLWEEAGSGAASLGGVSQTSAASTLPSLAISSKGTPCVAWQEAESSGNNIYFKCLSGNAWEGLKGSALAGGISFTWKAERPWLAFLPDGSRLVAWMDGSEYSREIFVRRWNAIYDRWEEMGDGSASGGGISDNPSDSQQPSLAVSTNGTAFTAWGDANPGDIYMRQYKKPPVDLSIVSVSPVQSVDGVDLVVGKETAIKVVVGSEGAAQVDSVPITVTYQGQPYTTYYWATRSNLVPKSTSQLREGSITFPLTFTASTAASMITETVFFFSHEFSPSAPGKYQVSAEVNYAQDPNQDNDLGTSNTQNIYLTNLDKNAEGFVELGFLSIDDGIIQEYMGDGGTAKFAAMLPVDESLVKEKNIGSIRTTITGLINDIEISNVLSEIYKRLVLASPTSSRYVAVLPRLWFEDHTYHSGNHGLFKPILPKLVTVENFGILDLDNHWLSSVIPLHELGHSYGLYRVPFIEEYTLYPKGRPVTEGLDVVRNKLLKDGFCCFGSNNRVFSVMGSIIQMPSWIYPDDYQWILNKYRNKPQQTLDPTLGSEVILVSGLLHKDGTFDLQDWWKLPGGTIDQPPGGNYTVEFQNASGGLLYQHTFSADFVIEGGTAVDVEPVSLLLPFPSNTSDIRITKDNVPLATRHVSANPPQVTLSSPNGGEVFDHRGTFPISWSGSDIDGGNLSYAVLYSPDGGANWQTLELGLTTTSYQVNARDLSVGTQNRIKVIATDGVNTGFDVSDSNFVINGITLLPVLSSGQPAANNPPNMPTNPAPASGAAAQSINTNLTWSGGDPDGDSVTYKVYLAANNANPTTLLCNNISANTCNPGTTLNYSTHYYWKVVATDEHGAIANGPVWDFTTTATYVTYTPTQTKTQTPTPTKTSSPTPTSTNLSTPDPREEIYIPAGSFQMGCSPIDTACVNDEKPLHTINLSAYYIDKYEVTNVRYAACVMAGNCSTPHALGSATRSTYYGVSVYNNYPVIAVDWGQANAFCQWEGKRLPTEAEWEKAARGSSDTRIYPWGNEAPDCTRGNLYLNGSGCIRDTDSVGRYPGGASPYGVMDMAGNVWEWVNDWYQANYYTISPPTDPAGPGSGAYRVLRGGTWSVRWSIYRVSSRYNALPTYQYNDTGFRCAR